MWVSHLILSLTTIENHLETPENEEKFCKEQISSTKCTKMCALVAWVSKAQLAMVPGFEF